jgi:hypothetical protein
MAWPQLIKRRGPLVIEDYTAMSDYRQLLVVECEPEIDGCGFRARFHRKPNNHLRARRAFRRHARRCAHVPPARHRGPLRWLAALVVLLAAIGFAVAAAVAVGPGRADSTPTTTTPAPYEYIPTPAGPPASSPAGGDR